MNTALNYIAGWMSSDRPDLVMRTMRINGWLRDHAPELDRLYGIPQPPEHHPEVDTGRHVELALRLAAEFSKDPKVRYAVLVHDLGKGLTPKEEWPQHFKHEERGVRPGLLLGRRAVRPALVEDTRDFVFLRVSHRNCHSGVSFRKVRHVLADTSRRWLLVGRSALVVR